LACKRSTPAEWPQRGKSYRGVFPSRSVIAEAQSSSSGSTSRNRHTPLRSRAWFDVLRSRHMAFWTAGSGANPADQFGKSTSSKSPQWTQRKSGAIAPVASPHEMQRTTWFLTTVLWSDSHSPIPVLNYVTFILSYRKQSALAVRRGVNALRIVVARLASPAENNREELELLPRRMLRSRQLQSLAYSTYGFQTPSLVSARTMLALLGAAL